MALITSDRVRGGQVMFPFARDVLGWTHQPFAAFLSYQSGLRSDARRTPPH